MAVDGKGRQPRLSTVMHTLGERLAATSCSAGHLGPIRKERLPPKSKCDVDLHQPHDTVAALISSSSDRWQQRCVPGPIRAVAPCQPSSGWEIGLVVPKAFLATERQLHSIQSLALLDGSGSTSRRTRSKSGTRRCASPGRSCDSQARTGTRRKSATPSARRSRSGKRASVRRGAILVSIPCPGLN